MSNKAEVESEVEVEFTEATPIVKKRTTKGIKADYFRRKPSKEYCYVPERFGEYDLRVLEAFRARMTEALLENPDGVRLPAGLGELKIMRFIPKNTPVHPGLTQQANPKGVEAGKIKRIKYNNDHSDGFVFKLFWFDRYNDGYQNSGGFKNSGMFVFRGNAPLNKGICDRVKLGDWKHFIISPSRFTLNNVKKIIKRRTE